ncbi:tartrate-resistant acid phosphatase type 5 family protein [Sphingomonas cannabina]|uniref:purple acid phosphatase family protein n=1 Tax=Sphingomonas cannabina TaxID=2899123 RepID=UPI001F325BFD|nr:tartrate-resistant acid phosphatase type 5 family protein [Sphingomonas cannabina]UIJ46285.1 tartrate-resistant acid phosphatase type 5 family protein [Sphingomonas cannabina]
MSTPSLTRRHVLGGLAVSFMPLSSAWARAGGPSMTFLVLGDWGRFGRGNQRVVADRMAETAMEIGAEFVLTVGDNFYENGVTGVDDPHWQGSFEDIYHATSLQVPWYASLGNHDYRGNEQAQIDYGARKGRWTMPGRWYSFRKQAPDRTTVEFFVIDTTPMISGYYNDRKTMVSGQDVEAQLRWLDHALAASRADWKIAIGHHPVVRYGAADKAAGPDLIDRVNPLLQRYQVPLYLHGHNHNLQHVQQGLTDHVCAGAGSQNDDPCSDNGGDFCALKPGFVACALNREAIRIGYRDADGTELHVARISRTA